MSKQTARRATRKVRASRAGINPAPSPTTLPESRLMALGEAGARGEGLVFILSGVSAAAVHAAPLLNPDVLIVISVIIAVVVVIKHVHR